MSPCEGIAPAPLLASLLSLAADLTSRGAGDAGAFPVLRRGVRQAVRIAGILLAFLEEIQEAMEALALVLPAPAVPALTELHVAMQKLRFLLTDCARRGARLWVLVNAGLAASELRAKQSPAPPLLRRFAAPEPRESSASTPPCRQGTLRARLPQIRPRHGRKFRPKTSPGEFDLRSISRHRRALYLPDPR